MLLLTLLLHYAIHYITRSRFEPRTYAKGLVLRARHVVGDAFTRGGGDNAASFPAACSQDYCNFAIFPQDKGLLISRPERAALLFGTLRDRINAALTSRLRDYPNYSGWDLIQVTRKYAGNEWWSHNEWDRSTLECICCGWEENAECSVRVLDLLSLVQQFYALENDANTRKFIFEFCKWM